VPYCVWDKRSIHIIYFYSYLASTTLTLENYQMTTAIQRSMGRSVSCNDWTARDRLALCYADRAKDDAYTPPRATVRAFSPAKYYQPALSPTTRAVRVMGYTHITIKYAILVKQFITQIAFAKMNVLILQKTNAANDYMTTDPYIKADRFDQIYQNILMEHVATYSRDIWDEVFSEHNIAIPLQYYSDIYAHLLTYSDYPFYTSETVRKHLSMNISRVYTTETYDAYCCRIRNTEHRTPTGSEYIAAEHKKYIQNSIIHDIFVYIIDRYGWKHLHICDDDRYTAEVTLLVTRNRLYSPFDTQPYYTYLEHFKKRVMQNGVCITDTTGNIEITESILTHFSKEPQWTNSAGSYYEIYTIWLIHTWLSL
jgi:hypothetical protein